jgi:ATP-dependent Clp protease ATP-binding subunit ClpA
VFERFTSQARTVVVRAHDESRRLGSGHIGTEHLLLGLLAPEAEPAASLLRGAGLDPDAVRADVARRVPAPQQLLSDEDAAALRTVGIDVEAVLARMAATFGMDAVRAEDPDRHPRRRGRGGRSRFTPRARKVLQLSLREAIRLRHDAIGTEHILLGLLREGRGVAVEVLLDAGVDLDRLRRAASAPRRAA